MKDILTQIGGWLLVAGGLALMAAYIAFLAAGAYVLFTGGIQVPHGKLILITAIVVLFLVAEKQR